MDMITLEAKPRDIKVSVSYIRKQRRIPGVYYGHNEKSFPIELEYQPFRKVFQQAGGNKLVELQIDGKKKPVLIHEVQFNPLTDKIEHVDFLHINMNEEITAGIPVVIKGIAPAVKDMGGILTTLRHEIEVKCLPKDLPEVIEVDVSGLAQLHSSIHLKDLTFAPGVKPMGAPEDVVVTVSVQKVQAEETAPVAAAVEGAAAAEGAAPGAAPAAGAPAGEKK